jgi:hypothetical protein
MENSEGRYIKVLLRKEVERQNDFCIDYITTSYMLVTACRIIGYKECPQFCCNFLGWV